MSAKASEADPFNRDPTVTYGAAEELAPGIRRITCENPSPMTFTGTQTYLIGGGDHGRGVAVVDPGPESPAHEAAILAALRPGEAISHVVVTHTHVDHSPAARALADKAGVGVWAYGPHGAGVRPEMAALAASGAHLGGGEGGDRAFAPDHLIADGGLVEGEGWALEAIHTPGHLSNHLSFAVTAEGLAPGAVLSGDHVMGWATTMVSPPDGDMSAFMASLERMAARNDRVFYPGHGHPVEDPAGMIAHQTAHRKARADQILSALAETPADVATLTARIYADVDPRLHRAAARNVFATLIGLVDAGEAAHEGALSPDAVYRRG